MKNLLIPIDGSEHSKKALMKGKEIAKAYDSNIFLLKVVDDLIPSLSLGESEKAVFEMREESDKLLKEAKGLLGDGYKVELVYLEGNIAKTIANYAEKKDVDLIIMGSQGLGAGRIREFFLGSVTNKVLHLTKKPILVV